MSQPVILRPEAERDIEKNYRYLETVRLGLGDKFKNRLRQVLLQIESQPELFGVIWKDVRAVRLRKFQYVLYYVIFTDRIEVLAVLHGFRHEAVWQSRA